MSQPTTTGTHPDCNQVADSKRPISSVTMTVDYNGACVITGPPGPDRTLTFVGSNTRTFDRVPLGAITPGTDPDDAFNRPAPGLGNFNVFDFGCACCKCRIGFVFDDFLPPTSPDLDRPASGIGEVLMFVTIALDDSMGDPSTTDVTTTGQFWSSQAAPCKVPDGPRLPDAPDLVVVAFTELPAIPLPYEYEDASDPTNLVTVTVSGTNSPTAGFPLSGVITFMEAYPCSDSGSYSYAAVYSNNFTDSDGNAQSFSLGVNFTLEYS